MTSKEYLNVHELASLFGLNVQTLHYYDKVGVFKPSDRDPGNRYRKYRFDQIYELASIRYMRKLGYSVGAVREFQDTREPDVSLKRLKERSAAIDEVWAGRADRMPEVVEAVDHATVWLPSTVTS